MTMTMVDQLNNNKLRWGDLEDEDDRNEDYIYFAPPEVITEPDANGVKKIISYKINEEGRKVKVTTTVRTRKLAKARLSKAAIQRRCWDKFGEAANKDEIGSRLTMVSTEEIILERPRAPGIAKYTIDATRETDSSVSQEVEHAIALRENTLTKMLAKRFVSYSPKQMTSSSSTRVLNNSQTEVEPNLKLDHSSEGKYYVVFRGKKPGIYTQGISREEGRKVKVTTTVHTRKLAKARLSKAAIQRRSWDKFGEAANKDEIGSRLTMVSTEEIILERPRAPGSKPDEGKIAGDPMSNLGKGGGAVLMVCRTCGKRGDHWTAQCPFKDLAQPPESFVDKPPASEAAAPSSGASKGAYVPPSQRAGADRSGQDMRRRNDENSVRVTNLSEDTREPDLQDLFSTFGPVSRVYIAYDQKTGMSRGFGFVNFVHKGDAEKAIAKLNGYGYDNLILRVEWAAPRTN